MAMEQGTKRPTQAQQERRRDHVVRLTLAHHSTEQVAAALGVSTATVLADRTARRGEIGGKVSPRKRFPPDPPAVDWMSEPRRVAPSYRDSLLTRPDGLLDTWRADNALSRFAQAAQDAEGEGDEEWRKRAVDTVSGILEYSGRLLRVLHDPEYRRWAATDAAARDDVGELFRDRQ